MASARIALASSLRLGIGCSTEVKTERDRAGRRAARAAIVADAGAVRIRLNNF
jgi:hypothetical protein